MPIVTRPVHKPPSDASLRDRLIAEWKGLSAPEPRPTIVQESDESGVVVHVYVVWTAWGSLDPLERSEIITEAYWQAFGEKGLALTVAMGLTPNEAARMHLDP